MQSVPPPVDRFLDLLDSSQIRALNHQRNPVVKKRRKNTGVFQRDHAGVLTLLQCQLEAFSVFPLSPKLPAALQTQLLCWLAYVCNAKAFHCVYQHGCILPGRHEGDVRDLPRRVLEAFGDALAVIQQNIRNCSLFDPCCS